MMKKCLVCGQEAPTKTLSLLLEEVDCPHCGSYRYELAFQTSYDFFLSQQSEKERKRIQKQMQKLIKQGAVCFVDDYEKVEMDGYALYALLDVLNPLGIDVAHNNTIDSNYKD